jgi:hypothetical protein
MMRNGLSVCYAVCVIFNVGGCNPNQRQFIKGVIYTKQMVVQHSILHGIVSCDDCSPLGGCKVSLSIDEEARKPLPGCQTQSNGKGEYQIDVTSVENPKDSYQSYYLVFQKEGYTPFVKEMRIGTLCPYLENTVILKQGDTKWLFQKP